MPDIILTTLNARYIHASLGLRYLYANMGALKSRTDIREFTIDARPVEIAEQLLRDKPAIIGIGLYIWNSVQATELAALIKTIAPEVTLVLGGPEISYETGQQAIYQYADYVVSGQADLAFAALCRQLLNGDVPVDKIIHSPQPALNDIALPYACFTADDIKHRIIYVEASRGCPFKCEFCLSSLDKTAWPFDIDLFLDQMQQLIDRGVKQFKFVDRTFNLKIDTSIRILEFFLEQIDKGLFLHFELIPDHLPERLKAIIKNFPHGTLQFEIGIQSFNPEVQATISRRQDNEKTEANIHWLTKETTAHLHTDLIVGLPGENLESFAAGFNRLVRLAPHEIQVGILKRLRGTPVIRHTDHYQMRYNPLPPYNILSNRDISFEQMQEMNRFARYWDMIANSGRFRHSLLILLDEHPFENFLTLTRWLYNEVGQTHKIALKRLFTLVYRAIMAQPGQQETVVKNAILEDFKRSGLKGSPEFIEQEIIKQRPLSAVSTPARQVRHQ